MHSSRMHTARSLPYREGSLSKKSLSRGSLSRGCLFRGESLSRGVSVGGVCQVDPLPRGQTNACENITLPQTSFAGGNNHLCTNYLQFSQKSGSVIFYKMYCSTSDSTALFSIGSEYAGSFNKLRPDLITHATKLKLKLICWGQFAI